MFIFVSIEPPLHVYSRGTAEKVLDFFILNFVIHHLSLEFIFM